MRTCERENAEKTSAVHFLRFELTAADGGGAEVAAARSAPASITRTTAHEVVVPASVRDALVADLG